MEYTIEQIEEFKRKADKWDALDEQIAKCYANDEDDDENDLSTIGEIAAIAFGWL